MKHAKQKLTIALLCGAGIFFASYMSVWRKHSKTDDTIPAPEERAFVDAWRHVARNPFPTEGTMRENGFAIKVQCENPVLQRLTIENISDTVLGNFWFYREGSPNFYSVATIIKSSTDEDQPVSEKVVALFGLFQTHYENFWPISPDGMLEDPPTLLASVGYGQCNLAANAFDLLCQSVGVETRGIGLELVENGQTRIAHNVMEAYFDGGWHYFDPDGRVFYRLDDGTIAGVEQLKADASPIRNGPAPIGYKREWYAAAFERGKVIVYEPRHPLRRKTMYEDLNAFSLMYRQAMRYDLPPGMKLILLRDRADKFFVRGLGGGVTTANVEQQPPCAHGQIVWRVPAGPFETDDFRYLTKRETIIAVKSPYVVTGGTVTLEPPDNASSVGFLPFIFGPEYKHEFTEIDLRGGTVAQFDAALPDFNPVTGFALKFNAHRLHDVQVTADIQHNPRALPKLVQGENRFVLWSPWPCAFTVNDFPTRSVVETDNGLRLCFEFQDVTQP